jgi:hypothetical protein
MDEYDISTNRDHLIRTPTRISPVSPQRTPGAGFFRDAPPHYPASDTDPAMSKQGDSDAAENTGLKLEDDEAGASKPAASFSMADLSALTAAFAAALTVSQANAPAPIMQASHPVPAQARVFVPVIQLIANRNNFFSTKYWDKHNNYLAYHRKNWDLWVQELVRSLALVGLERYIDLVHGPGSNYLPRPTIVIGASYEQNQSAYNWGENDANVRRLIRGVIDSDEFQEVAHCGTAKAMFDALKTRHGGGTAVTQFSLWERLMNVQVHATSAEEIFKPVAEARRLVDHIFTIGQPTKDSVLMMALLRAMGTESASHVQRALLSDIARDDLTMDTLMRRLRTEAELTGANGTGVQTIAVVVTEDTQCVRCAGFGHIARKCASAPDVTNAKHIQAALNKTSRPPNSGAQPGPFKSYLPAPTRGRGGARGGYRGNRGSRPNRGGYANVADGSASDHAWPDAIEVGGYTYYPAAQDQAAAAALAGQQEEESYSDTDGSGWFASAQLDLTSGSVDPNTINAILAAEPTVSAEPDDEVFAAMVKMPRPPAIPLNAEHDQPYQLTTNPHTVAHLGSLEWFLDSGATMHCTPDLDDLVDARDIAPIPIRGVSGQRIYASKIGTVFFKVKGGTRLIVPGVLYIPDAALRLISIGRLADAGMDTRFSKHHATIIRQINEKCMATATRASGGLYSIDLTSAVEERIAAATTGVPISTWHGRLGHPAGDAVERLARTGAATGMHVDLSSRPPACQPCIRGKQKQSAMPKHREEGKRSAAFLDLVFIDLTGGPDRTATPNKEHYAMSMKDDSTSWVWTFLLRTKKQAIIELKAWHLRVTIESGLKLKAIQIDNGELKSEELDDWAALHGIEIRYTAPYSSAQNGRIERTHLTIDNCARAMRIAADLPETTWGEFVLTSSYLHNYRLTKSLPNGVTPYEARKGKKPNLSHLREIGCKAFVLIQNRHVTKIEPRSSECILVGYDLRSKAYRLWNRALRKIVVSRNVHFVESHQLAAQPYRPGVTIGQPAPGGAHQDGWPNASPKGEVPKHPSRPATPGGAPPAEQPNASSKDEVPKCSEAAHELPGRSNSPPQGEVPKRPEDARACPPALDKSPEAMNEKRNAPVPAPVDDSPPPRTPPASPPRPRVTIEDVEDEDASSVPRSPHGPPRRPHVTVEEVEDKDAPSTPPSPRVPRERRAPLRKDADPHENARYARVVNEVREGQARAKARRQAGKATMPDIFAVMQDESRPVEDILGMIGNVDDGDVTIDQLFGEMLDDELIDWAASMNMLDDESTMTLKQALAGPERDQWRQALVEEFAAIRKMGVYRLIHRRDVPAGRRILRGKPVFKSKRNEVGDVIRYKVRWVVKGFLQVFGDDYTKTTSPTARLETFRILCHITATHDLEMCQFDVKTAFLHGELADDEHIYMDQPSGFEEPGTVNDYVWEVLKGLYGMKQAGRVWDIKLNDVFVDALKFHRVSSEHCLYVRRSKTGFALASIHVDDTFAVGSSVAELDALEADLKKHFEITVADGSFILGIHVQRDREKRLIHLSQTALIDKVVKRFSDTKCHAVSTPMEHGAIVSTADSPVTAEDHEAVRGKPYGELIGSLQYLAQGTRPDIAYATARLATVLNRPGLKHWNMALRVVRYLHTTRTYGITLGGPGGKTSLCGMTDSDFANCPDSRCSVSGYAFSLGTGAISWKSKKQDLVTTSTTEAEYVAMCAATKEALWLRGLLHKIGFTQERASVLGADNQGAVVLSEDQANHARMKHIDVRFHFVRERVLAGDITFKWVQSQDNVADIFTKPLPYAAFSLLRKRLGVQAYWR